MACLQNSAGSALIPKVLGIYEKELTPVLESMVKLAPDVLLDVGCAEGYYAVGMRRRLPASSRVRAYDIDPAARTLLAELCRLNNVEGGVEIATECTHAELERECAQARRPCIICDIEGFEDKLLDPTQAASLAKAHILVELHEFLVPGVGMRLRNRFGLSHTIEEIVTTPRARSEFPFRSWYSAVLPHRYLDWAVSEWRPGPMSWLWMRPKVQASAPLEGV
ncbi:MAG: hypothetical protein ABMA01_05135 [Chthoniobacteraceae bacterium]